MQPPLNKSWYNLALVIISATFGWTVTIDNVGWRIVLGLLCLVATFVTAGKLFSANN